MVYYSGFFLEIFLWLSATICNGDIFWGVDGYVRSPRPTCRAPDYSCPPNMCCMKSYGACVSSNLCEVYGLPRATTPIYVLVPVYTGGQGNQGGSPWQPPSSGGGAMSSPRRGPQCKYGYSQPHNLCLYDSPNLIALEPALISEVLNRHNYYRARVNPPARTRLPNLSWDTDLAIEAERWAAQCKFEHSTGDSRVLPARAGKPAWDWVGQNLCWSSGYNQTWTNCIDNWASEVNDWQYGVGKVSDNQVGHYTQMIWADTRYVGCGKSRCQSETYGNGEENNLVCHYGPGGNVGFNGADPYARPYQA